jgi:beta-glucosidase
MKRVVVIGPHAAEVMLGGYSGVPRHSVSILEGIRDRLGKGLTVTQAEGVRHRESRSRCRPPPRWMAARQVQGHPRDSGGSLPRTGFHLCV